MSEACGRDGGGCRPHGRLATLKTPVYLLHGAGGQHYSIGGDAVDGVGAAEGALKAVLVSPVLSHLDLDGAGPRMVDQWRLVHFFAWCCMRRGEVLWSRIDG